MLAAKQKKVKRQLGDDGEKDEEAKLPKWTTTLPRSNPCGGVDPHHDLAGYWIRCLLLIKSGWGFRHCSYFI